MLMKKMCALSFIFMICACSTEQKHVQREVAAEASDSPIAIPKSAEQVATENQATSEALAYLKTSPLRDKIVARAAELAPQAPAVPIQYFQQSFAISAGSLVRKDPAQDTVVVDIHQYPAGSSVADYRPSPDGAWLSFGITTLGSQWQTWYILNQKSGQISDGPFYIKSLGEIFAWSLDSRAVFYLATGTIAEDQQGIRHPRIMMHTLGGPVTSDAEIFRDPEEPATMRYMMRPLNDKFLVVYRVLGVAEVPLALYLVPIPDFSLGTSSIPIAAAQALIPRGRHWGRFVGIAEGKILYRTSENGPHYSVVAVDPFNLKSKPTMIVKEQPDQVLVQAQQFGQKLVLTYLDAELNNQVVVTDMKGQVVSSFRPRDFSLIDYGTLGGFFGDFSTLKTCSPYSSVELAPITICVDVNSGQFSLLNGAQVNFDAKKIERKLEYAKSSDGASVPYQVFTRKDQVPNFVYIYFYGSIGANNLPQWNRKFELALDLGAAVVVVQSRGGAEFGLDWQLAGTKDRFLVMQDVLAASRSVRKKYALAADRVVVTGRSYGGMMTLATYGYAHSDYGVFSSVVPIGDIERALNEVNWWALDDVGYVRDPKSGNIVMTNASKEAVHAFNPRTLLESLPLPAEGRPLPPIALFAESQDSNVGSRQAVDTYNLMKELYGKQANVLMYIHPGGHGSKLEYADEATFLQLKLNLNLNPVSL